MGDADTATDSSATVTPTATAAASRRGERARRHTARRTLPHLLKGLAFAVIVALLLYGAGRLVAHGLQLGSHLLGSPGGGAPQPPHDLGNR